MPVRRELSTRRGPPLVECSLSDTPFGSSRPRIASLGLAGSAQAASADAACFGQVHKTVNSGVLGVDDVGQLVVRRRGPAARGRTFSDDNVEELLSGSTQW